MCSDRMCLVGVLERYGAWTTGLDRRFALFPFGLKLPVLVLPVGARWDGLKRVPMLGNFAVFDAIEVVDARGYAAEVSLCDDEYEVPFAKYFVNILINDRLTLCCESLQPGEQAWNGIGNPRIVLDIGFR